MRISKISDFISSSTAKALSLSLLGFKNLDRQTLLYKVAPYIFMEALHKYFRVEVVGAEKILKSGRMVITPNHSGYSGIDAMLLAHEVHRKTKRLPRVLAHHFWFLSQSTSIPAKRFGFVEATTKNGLEELNKNRLIVLFPEGEKGNFKPSLNAYRLQEFKRGFIRMALETQAPILPTLILGAEESHLNLSQIRLKGKNSNLLLPIPLNIIPLPAKWKIKFLDPIYLPYKASAANDSELVHEVAQNIREKMQRELNLELKRRHGAFLG